MRASLFLFILLISTLAHAQSIDTQWYSQKTTNGVTIQNSYPKGGRYSEDVEDKFNCSYLVFFTRLVNGSNSSLEINIDLSSDSIAIPNSPETFMKLFLPSDTMTLDKQNMFSYGIKDFELPDEATNFKRTLKPQEECLFYVVAFFYQTEAGQWSQERGGNRAELVSIGNELFYRMPPQIPSISCGQIVFEN